MQIKTIIRVLLTLVDVKEPRHCIKELEKIAIVSNLSMVLCWSNEEVARYLETFKAYEFKSAEAIMEKATTTAPGQSKYQSYKTKLLENMHLRITPSSNHYKHI